jgi:hypothetical protein
VTAPRSFRALAAEWPHDFTKLSGVHDGAEKKKCRRCQLEALCAEWEQEIRDAMSEEFILERLLGKEPK